MSDDDNLIEALKAALHERSGAITPSPMPVPDVAARPVWRRPPVIGGAAVAMAAAAALVVALQSSSPEHASRVVTGTGPVDSSTVAPGPTSTLTFPNPSGSIVGPSGPTSSAPPPTPPTVNVSIVSIAPSPASTTLAGPIRTAPATAPSSPAPRAGAPVANGFQPVSATFVSASEGWVAGGVPCPAPPPSTVAGVAYSCVALAHTTDGGATWTSTPSPVPAVRSMAQAGDNPFQVQVRFADARDGWFFTQSPQPSILYSTHDGGATWSPEAVPGGGTIDDLAAANGVAHAVVLVSGNAGARYHVYSTPTTTDSWTESGTSFGAGAGPVPRAAVTLQGSTGWIVDNDRVVIDGARLTAGGWTAWTPPCRHANGSATLAAASTTALLAVCDEGVWGPPDPGTGVNQNWLFRSSDGGGTFTSVGPVPVPSATADSVAAAPGDASKILVAGPAGVTFSADGGRSWATVAPPLNSALAAAFVGYSTSTRAVAVLAGVREAEMIMSHDGGRTWSPVTF